MSLEAVYEIIAQAKHSVLQNARYREWLEEWLLYFHRSIQISSQNPLKSLEEFVLSYLDLAPRMLECIEQVTRSAGLSENAAPFLTAGKITFCNPD